MRRGAPLSQQNEKAPVVSTHPNDVQSIDFTAYDKTQKSGQTSGSSSVTAALKQIAIPAPPTTSYSRSNSATSSSTTGIASGASAVPAKQLPSMESMSIGSHVHAGAGPTSYGYGSGGPVNTSHAYRPSNNNSSKHNRIAHAFLTKHDPVLLQNAAIATTVIAFILKLILPLTAGLLALVFGAVILGVLCSLWLSRSVLEKDDGTAEMRAVSDPIREGAEGFLRVQYSVSFTSISLVE